MKTTITVFFCFRHKGWIKKIFNKVDIKKKKQLSLIICHNIVSKFALSIRCTRNNQAPLCGDVIPAGCGK